MKHRVVITGIGICTALGAGANAFWEALTRGRSGISVISIFDASALPVRIGGQVKEPLPAKYRAVFPEASRERDRKVLLGMHASWQAMLDSGVEAKEFSRAALVMGASLETFFLQDISSLPGNPASGVVFQGILRELADRALQSPLNRLAEILAKHHGFGRGQYTNCSACAAGTHAIGEAFRRIRDGTVELALAGASDSVLNPLAMGGFSLLKILSEENDNPSGACRPFDATRAGTVLGEGAAFLVMETLRHAEARGARIYAEVMGYGSSLDAYRVTDPEPGGRGAAVSMRKAMADAELVPEQIDCVNAHATGTLKNDVAETLAIKQALGGRAAAIPVTANKSMTGHLIAASGAVEAVASALTLHERIVPPTINLSTRDSQCNLDYVAEGCRPFHGRTVLSNSFGFGGQNATLIFGRAPTVLALRAQTVRPNDSGANDGAPGGL